LKNSTIVITGATGLIGSNLVNAIAYNNQEKKLGLKMILPVRNTDQANKMFNWTGAEIVSYNLGECLEMSKPVEYIIHLASPTSSRFFVERPADTLSANIEGTKALLEQAKEWSVKKFIYLSSMEVYGFPKKGHKVAENELGSFETMNARNSYPLAKITCEALCNSYFVQHNVPAVVLRATQTFGPGVKYEDGRVFAEFMRCALENKDIVLKTAGLTERSYLYTGDAVSAILVSILRGIPGQAYTIANPETYCSIREMAEMVIAGLTDSDIQVVIGSDETSSKSGYADTLYMDLDVHKIESLGWRPMVGLIDMYSRMIRGVKEDGCIE